MPLHLLKTLLNFNNLFEYFFFFFFQSASPIFFLKKKVIIKINQNIAFYFRATKKDVISYNNVLSNCRKHFYRNTLISILFVLRQPRNQVDLDVFKKWAMKLDGGSGLDPIVAAMAKNDRSNNLQLSIHSFGIEWTEIAKCLLYKHGCFDIFYYGVVCGGGYYTIQNAGGVDRRTTLIRRCCFGIKLNSRHFFFVKTVSTIRHYVNLVP